MSSPRTGGPWLRPSLGLGRSALDRAMFVGLARFFDEGHAKAAHGDFNRSGGGTVTTGLATTVALEYQ